MVISFYFLWLLSQSINFDNNAPSDEALRVTICIASPRSSRNTLNISTSYRPPITTVSVPKDGKLPLWHDAIQKAPKRRTTRRSKSLPESRYLHLALPAPQRHYSKSIIAYLAWKCNPYALYMGTVKRKAVPSEPVETSSMVPSCSSTVSLHIASPSPLLSPVV